MKAWMLPVRRLWWFATDTQTTVTFNYLCDHCKDQIVLTGRGFRLPRAVQHTNPLCKYAPFFRHIKRPFSLTCRSCWRARYVICRYWVVNRWRFRLKYNWGVGLTAECLAGNHQWPKEPDAIYEDGDTHWLQGTCLRCGFTHRWGQKIDQSVRVERPGGMR